jgi:hypothetical protein
MNAVHVCHLRYYGSVVICTMAFESPRDASDWCRKENALHKDDPDFVRAEFTLCEIVRDQRTSHDTNSSTRVLRR